MTYVCGRCGIEQHEDESKASTAGWEDGTEEPICRSCIIKVLVNNDAWSTDE
jgi:hypothetical protein